MGNALNNRTLSCHIYRLFRFFRGYDMPSQGMSLRPPQKNMMAMPKVSAFL